MLGPGATIMYLLAKIARELWYYCQNKRWIKPEKSSWNTDDGKVRWSSVIPLVGNILCNIGITVVMTFAWDFAA